VRRPTLFHQDRREPRVCRACLEQLRQYVRPQPQVEIIDVRLDQQLCRRTWLGVTDEQADDIGPVREIAATGSDADRTDPHRWQRAVPRRVFGQDRRPGRRAQLHVDRAAVRRNACSTSDF